MCATSVSCGLLAFFSTRLESGRLGSLDAVLLLGLAGAITLLEYLPSKGPPEIQSRSRATASFGAIARQVLFRVAISSLYSLPGVQLKVGLNFEPRDGEDRSRSEERRVGKERTSRGG